MTVITINEDGTLQVMSDEPDQDIVVIDIAGRWTDSPLVEQATEDEMVEWLMAHRNAGYEDRNP